MTIQSRDVVEVRADILATDQDPKVTHVVPVLPLKDMVAFPFMLVPLFVVRERSIDAIEEAISNDRMVFLVAQRDPSVEEPGPDDLYGLGTLGVLMRVVRVPEDRIRVVVQGLSRARIVGFEKQPGHMVARIQGIDEIEADETEEDIELEALIRNVKQTARSLVEMGKQLSPEVMVVLENLEEPGRLADLIISNLEIEITKAQEILETLDPAARLTAVNRILAGELELLTVQERISSQARGEIERYQREYFLRQQLKAIRSELGEGEDLVEEIEQFRLKATEHGLPQEAREEALRQISRLEHMQSDSAEASLIRGYLDWTFSLPWNRSSDDNLNLKKAQQILDENHYNLADVKTRIIEYLAVLKLRGRMHGGILCFVGPPGVGKTSFGKSIARALGRKFVRISLGGLHDEAEIRGHRRTYVGALPGKIIHALRTAGTNNPVVLLDEIDKMGHDLRGDPAAALLEILDPEQNSAFRDNYLGVGFDLSKVLFIATANVLESILPAFRDRLEVLPLSGYDEEEKCKIATRFLIPKQLAANGLSRDNLRIAPRALRSIVNQYTDEAGLRNLERCVASICRKVARKVAEGDQQSIDLKQQADLVDFLGPARRKEGRSPRRDSIGAATALAWTASGGEILLVECTALKGKGRLIMTGQLGEILKESVQAAMSYARSRSAELELDDSLFEQMDFHIHLPEGAIPKDGPSAGTALATALISASTRRPVRHDVALTGEITLRGQVLAVGGIKEKIMAARRSRIPTVILPKENQPDAKQLPEAAIRGVELVFVQDMDQVLRWALRPPQARPRPGEPKARKGVRPSLA